MSHDLIDHRYTVRRTLHSSTTLVQQVTDDTGADLVLKSIPGHDATLEEQLRNEFLILSNLRHASIVQAQRFGVCPNLGPYLILEYLGDSTLATRRMLLPDQVRSVLLQLALALDYLAIRGILHRDISPSNIILSSHDTPSNLKAFLIDFGMATPSGNRSRTPCGTFEFMAPEVLEGGPQTIATDLYALGASVAACVDTASLSSEVNATLSDLTDKKSPDKRLDAWARLLVEAWPSPSHTRTSMRELLHRPPLKGCTSPIGRVREALLDLSSSDPSPSHKHRVFVISGEGGIGKSRLCSEIEAHSVVAGRRTILVKCSTDTLDPLGSLFQACSLRRTGESSRGANALSGRYVGNNSTQLHAIHSLANSLQRLSATEHLTLLFEDIHWADPETLELMRLLAVQSSGPLVVLTCLSESRLHADLEALLRFLDARPSVAMLELARFSEADTIDFLAGTIGYSPDVTEMGAAVFKLTEGNPLLIQEALLDISDSGAFLRRPGGFSLNGSKLHGMESAKTLALFAERKLSTLAPHLRRLVEVLSVIDGTATSERLASLSGRNPRAVHQDLELMTSQGLLIGTSSEHGCLYTFRHRCTRELAYDSIEPARRRSIHRAFAELLEELTPHSENLLNRIAHHYIQAADFERAPDYAFRAAQLALERFAVKRAIELYTSGLDLVPGGSLEKRFHALETLGTLLVMTGSVSRAKTVYHEMQLLARSSAARLKEAVATRELAKLLIDSGEVDKGISYADHAIDLFSREADTGGELVATLLKAQAMHQQGDTQTAAKIAADANDRAVVCQDPYAQSMARLIQGLIACEQGNYKAAIDYHEDSLRLKTSLNDIVGIAVALCNLGLAYLEQGILSTARNYYERALVEARDKGMSVAGILASVNLGEINRLTGELEASEYLLREALALADGSNRRYLAAYSNYSLSFPSFLKGQLIEARVYLDRAESLQRFIGNCGGLALVLSAKAGLCRAWGQKALATQYTREALEIARESGNPHALNTAFAAVIEDVADADSSGSSPQPVDCDLNAARALGRTPSLVHLLQSFAKHRLKDGKETEAIALLVEAKGIAKEAGLMPDLARGAMIEGQALLRLQKRAEARAVLEEGAAEARRMGLRPLLSHLLYWLAQAQEAVGDAAGASESLFEAADLVNAIAAEIGEDDLQQSYLRVPINAAIRDWAERLERAGLTRRATSSDAKSPEEIAGQAVDDVSRQLGADAPLRDLLTAVLDRAIEAIRADRGLVFLFDSNSHEVTIARDLEGETIQDATDYCRSILEDVAAGQPILSVDVPSDDRFRQRRSVVLYKILSLMCVPLTVGDRILGALYFDSRSGRRAFRDADLRLARAFSDRFARAIVQAQDEQALREKAIVVNREMAERYRLESLVGESPAMKRLFKMMESVIRADCNVLITGESGTGKELVARAVHYEGPRKLRNFVPLDCGAVPENLVESELFGHRRGAFTGADTDKRGLFEEADGGTLFLDEITNTSPPFQAKLLRALQSGEFRRLGETATRRADVRIIAATNGDIERAIKEGRFREDLYYRLNVVTLSLPPLRERDGDVLLLAEHIARRMCDERGITFRGIGRGAAARLLSYSWPGNVRELEHAVEAALVVSEDGLVRREALPEKIRGGDVDAVRDLLRHEVAAVGGEKRPKDEKSLIQDALGRCGGDKSRAARLLGWSRMRLYRRMKALDIPYDSGRN